MSQTPGGLHERFFEEIGQEMKDGSKAPVFEDPPDMENVAMKVAEAMEFDPKEINVHFLPGTPDLSEPKVREDIWAYAEAAGDFRSSHHRYERRVFQRPGRELER